jgi:uncharacterized protein (TIGR03435 family)
MMTAINAAMLAVAVVLAIAMSPLQLVAAPQAAPAQVPAPPAPPKLEFEVASVRASGPAGKGVPLRGGPPTVNPGRITYQRTLFRQLLMDAYGVQRDQIKGPDWATADAVSGGALFDISANIPPGATKEQVAMMLQNLLKERFKLSLHHETVQSSGFALVVAGSGPKLTTSAGPVRESERSTPGARGAINLELQNDGFPNLSPGRGMGGTFNGGTVRMRFRDYPLSDLVQQFSFALGMRLIDRTGLSGTYDFTLEFTPPENGIQGGRFTMALSPGQTAPLNPAGPSPGQLDSVPRISSAMERQLGLKLEATKIAVDMLVIDHVEKTPTEN